MVKTKKKVVESTEKPKKKVVKVETVKPVETIEKGNHLTVRTDKNGRITLEWDWDALMDEVVKATGLPIKKETKKRTKK